MSQRNHDCLKNKSEFEFEFKIMIKAINQRNAEVIQFLLQKYSSKSRKIILF